MGTVHRLATLIGATLLVIATALSPRVEAGAADDAKRAYEEGVSHFESGRFPEAADAFRKAYELKPIWKLLYNIGQSEAAAKR
jgi:Flp pilus assembly protein TadD